MKIPFTVIPAVGSEDTARCIDELHRHRRRIIGLAYVVLYTGRNYETHLCGEAERSPTFARGAVQVLDDKLSDRIHGRS